MPSLSLAEWIERGRGARRERRLEEAKDCFIAAVALGRRSVDRVMLAQALTGLGQTERDMGNSVSAIKHYLDAAEVYRTLENPLALAHSVRHAGDILREQGRLAEAKPHYNEALGIYREHAQTPPLYLANTLRGCALLQDALGLTEEAMLLWHEAVALYEAAGVEAGVAECRSHLAFHMGR